jgi:hypothetical protein
VRFFVTGRGAAWTRCLPEERRTLGAPLGGPRGTVIRGGDARRVGASQADLGFRIGVAGARTGYGRGRKADRLVVDDTYAAVAALGSARRIALVADNARPRNCWPTSSSPITCCGGRSGVPPSTLKPMPYYSPTPPPRFVRVPRSPRGRRRGRPALAGRLRAAADEGRFIVTTHGFHCTPSEFSDAPADLFAGADVVVFKGDLNYRRLVGDLRLGADRPLRTDGGPVPGSVVALRTLKSDVVVGLSADVVSRLDAEAHDWRVSGRYAMVQVRV